MSKVELSYNPYLLETTLLIDDEELNAGPIFELINKNRLDLWVEKIIPQLANKLNEKEFTVFFNGIPQDFEDVQKAAADFNNSENGRVKVEARPGLESNSPERKLQALKTLMEKALDAPIPGLAETRGLSAIRDDLKLNTFEIYVIATMSSGKSTLINALLGRDILPAANKATTAAVTRIINDASRDGFSGNAYDEEKKPFADEPIAVDLKTMEKWNKEAARIEISGPMEINKQPDDQGRPRSSLLNLVIVDTPGPNSAGNTGHKLITHKAVEKETPPLILFIIDCTQEMTNDMDMLLRHIAEHLKDSGKRVSDRFLFMANRVDELDPAKEDINEALERHKSYLEDFEIAAPRIIPVCSLLPKLIRSHRAGADLSKHENSKMTTLQSWFAEDEDRRLLQYVTPPKTGKRVPVSSAVAQRIRKRIAAAEAVGDTQELAVLHSGIPTLEEAIWEYVSKYGLTEKVNNLMENFRREFSQQKELQDLLSAKAADEDKLKELNEALKTAGDKMATGEEAKRFRTRLRALSLKDTKFYTSRLGKIRSKFYDDSQSITATIPKKKVPLETGKMHIDRITDAAKTACENLERKFQEMLRAVIDEHATPIWDEYLKYGQAILENVPEAKQILESVNCEFKIALPKLLREADFYQATVREKVGEEKISNVVIWKPWTWFKEPSYRGIYENREVLDMPAIATDVSARMGAHFEKSQTSLEKSCEESFAQIISTLEGQLDEIDRKMEQVIAEWRRNTGSKEEVKKALALKKKQIDWLENFQQELENCLSLGKGGIHG